ncbi:hypothetical protein [Leuconostoc mesenteroides]|uniref:hypothetical protein n=1 Tax=Leuconostoc mesenteroides TaxID=1245 RepID=UPI0038589C57
MSKPPIKFSFDSSSLDKKLKKMSKQVKEVSKPRKISADVVLTDKWIASHTTKNSLAQFENDAPFDGDFSDPKLINESNSYVSSISKYRSFEDMLHSATDDWIASQLKF